MPLYVAFFVPELDGVLLLLLDLAHKHYKATLRLNSFGLEQNLDDKEQHALVQSVTFFNLHILLRSIIIK